MKKWRIFIICSFFLMVGVNHLPAQEVTKPTVFKAEGPTQPEKRPPREVGTIKVTFDLLPTTMSFDMPWTYCMVTENNIKFANFAAETYDPRDFDGTGGAASFEPGMDREGRYVRAWIEHQSDARIVVRIRYALANNLYDIAHPDIPSGSPYGNGDWADEWHYIYPDGSNTRHMRVYTGLAQVSKPFGFDREPPKTVHEFMEMVAIGQPGRYPTDDIEIDAVTLIKTVGGHTENFYEDGISTTISYKPYPEDFGDFRDANILLANLKSEYKPFTIARPYGVRVQPYMPEGPIDNVFIIWGNPEKRGYTTPFGHFINYWHYRRSVNTLEQIYLHGMTNTKDPVKDLVALGYSWIREPVLRIEGWEPDYTYFTYDPAQKAYIVPRKGRGSIELNWTLSEPGEGPMHIINPTFIVKDWDMGKVKLEVDGKPVEAGKDFRIGYEETPSGHDLVLWLKMNSTKPAKFSITPASD